MADPTAIGRGMGGTLVCSIFESLGYQFQGHILTNFEEAFKGQLGGFVFLIGIVVALFSVATRGSYKLGSWLLIGPPLFFAVVMKRQNAAEVEWRFAEQARDQAEVTGVLDRLNAVGFTPPGGQQARVSILFQKYNHMISATSQALVKVINNNRQFTDKSFILKGRALAALFSGSIEQQGLHELISWGLMSECRKAVDAARITIDPLSTADQRAVAKFDDEFNRVIDGRIERTKMMPRSAAEYLADEEIFGSGGTGADLIAAGDFEGLYELRALTITRIQETPYTCKKIWQMIYEGLLRGGRLRVKAIQGLGENNEVPSSEFLAKIAQAVGIAPGANQSSASFDRLAKMAALYILRNSVRAESSSGLIDQMANRGNDYKNIEVPLESELAITELARTTSTEWAEKTRMLMSAENLPYYQGMILFFLAMSFPFFAMLLLVPGKHAGFLMWFLFWLWAKSWDVGFALVMQLDDILFSIFGMHQLYNTQGRNMEITQDLATTIWAIRELDPSFNLSTYYNIMAVCLMSIPVVTSQLILGGLTGGAGLVSSGMNLSIGEFARGAQTAQAQAAISNLKYELNDYKMEAARGTQQHWGGMPIVRANASGGEIGANYSSRSGRTVPQPVGMPNRSPIGSKSGVITPAAQPYTLGDLSQRMEGLQRLARVKGMASGAADPRGVDLLPDVKGFWERMGFGRARMEQVIKAASAISTTAGKGIERIYAQKLKNEIAALEADIDVMTSYAVNDAIYSERGKKLAFMIRLYGGIEVPINAETPPMLAEADREIKMRRMELDSYATFLDLLADGMGGVGKLGTALSKHRNMGEAYDAMLAKGSGMNPGAINWASGDWTKALPRGAPVGEFQTLLMQRLAPPGVATWTILDLPGFRGPGREPEMPKEHPGVGFGGEAPLSYRLRDEDGGGIRGIPATALAFADDVRRRAVDDDDGPGFAFTGFGRGAGTDELGWMRTEAWLNSSSGGGGGSTVAINYVSDSGGGGSDFGGGGDYVAMEVGSFFTASRFRPSIGDDAFGGFSASRQDSSWAFAPVGAGGSHEPNSSHFAPVNLDGHGSGGGVGHGGPEKLVANIGFGELPLDLSPEEREEIERNPNAAQEIIQRRRGGNKGGGSTIV